jgi:hypothetical protein
MVMYRYVWLIDDFVGIQPPFIGFETISHEDVIQKSIVDG